MDSSQPDPLTDLQRDLLREFFAREQRLFLTGGAALAGFYLHHRKTEDLDLFTRPGLDLAWVLADLRIDPEARVPGGVDPGAPEAFRSELVARLRRMAFDRARGR